MKIKANKEYLKKIETLIDTLEEDKVNMAFEMINKLEDAEYYLKGFRDYHNTLEYAKKEGSRKVAENVAKTAIQKGFDNETIAELTKLSLEEIEKLKSEL